MKENDYDRKQNPDQARIMEKKRWFAVVNPASASGRTGKLWLTFREKLEAAGWVVEYVLTSGPWEAVSITQAALERGERRIMAVGGDGTLNEVVNGFFSVDEALRQEAELAVLTYGTGSDFIRTLGIERGLDSFLKVLNRAEIMPVDVGRVEYENIQGEVRTRYFLNVADVGLGAAIAGKVNQTGKVLGGKISFLYASIKVILSYRNKIFKCLIDGETVIEGRLNSVMVANGRYFGGGMMIAPEADLADGQFDVIILGDFSTLQLLRHLPKIYRGSHLKVPGVLVYRGRTVAVQSRDKLMLELDGEQPGFAPVKFSIIPQALKLWR